MTLFQILSEKTEKHIKIKSVNDGINRTTIDTVTTLSTFICNNVNIPVVIETNRGDIYLELYANQAPVTVTNFLSYVDSGLYQNSWFYRTVTLENQPLNEIKIEVIQGGLYDETSMLPEIAHETTTQTGIRHENGVLSMARNEPGSATSEIFICIGDQPELDFGGRRNPDGQGFAAFGRVTRGMDVVIGIQGQPQQDQMLIPRILIKQIRRE